MVLRKNVPQAPEDGLVPRPLSQAANNPPYPLTPSDERPMQLPASPEQPAVYSPDLNESPAFRLKPLDEARKKREKQEEESDYSENEWDQSDDETPDDLPDPLKIGGGKPLPAPTKKNELPDVLRAGPPPGVEIKRPPPSISPDNDGALSSSHASNASAGSVPLKTNNPYLKMQQTGQSNFGAESSQQVWGDAPSQTQTYKDPVELPSFHTPDTPTNPMANLSLNSNVPPVESSKSPDQPPLIAVESATPHSAHPQQGSDPSTVFAPGMDASSLDVFAKQYGQSNQHQENDQHAWQEQREIERSDREAKNQVEEEHQHQQEPSRVEPAPVPPAAPFSHFEEEQAPALPPRRSQEEQPPALPLRPLETGIPSSTSGPESPNTVMNKQRKETYQIKHIRWHDINKRGIRTSPILTQNVNGPCPLLALVNALVLSTPPEIETALVETLRTREQVSLGLLLDAVFDELMSGRRGDAAQELPDVGELYKFLLALHTGLNVNPTFVRDPDATDGTSMLTAHAARPGGFENTRDMRLYRTFNLALMHGWLPEPGSDAYVAFDMIAKTYETSQYVQFQEEELDAKLQTGEALTTDEQQMFTNIHAIKEFLNQWPTQLTNYGLKTMRESLKQGQVAILFRNDHFSTLYKDPRTDNLVTLVTDQGYSSHDEIVWESLVDVNGQGSELFSGDFRPVGSSISPQVSQTQQPVRSMLDVDDTEGWTTVSRRNNSHSSPANLMPSSDPTSPAAASDLSRTEQEDHDLALALQLQEEEDNRHRLSQEERRRQENALSEHAIAQQAQTRPPNQRVGEALPPLIPPRRNNVTTHRPVSSEPAPPPTYEEAAVRPAYHPPMGHPASPTAPVRPQGSAYQMNSNAAASMQGQPGRRPQGPMMHGGSGMGSRPGRRASGLVGSGEEGGKDKCVVM